MSIYTGYLLTPGVEFADGDFVPKASPEEADEVVDREGEGSTAYALTGFDTEGDRWEVLMVTYRPTTLVRRVRMMFGLRLEWDGSAPMNFDRGDGIEIVKYARNSLETAIAFGGLMSGMPGARKEWEFARAQELADRLGVVIRDDSGK